MQIVFIYEDESDCHITKHFGSLESLQHFVKREIAHDIGKIGIRLQIDGNECDVKEYIEKVANTNNGKPYDFEINPYGEARDNWINTPDCGEKK